uniref:phage holin family protein n=1 Tax=Emticicia sp. TaxID=1930953 RepID=UPI003753D251
MMFKIGIYFFKLLNFYTNKSVLAWVLSLSAIEIFLTEVGFNGPLLAFLLALVLLDSVTGFWAAYRKAEVSSKGWAKFIDKVIVYFVLVGVTWWIMRLGKSNLPQILWTDDVILIALIFRELTSIIENLGKINAELVPSWILKKLKQFNENGEYIPTEK